MDATTTRSSKEMQPREREEEKWRPREEGEGEVAAKGGGEGEKGWPVRVRGVGRMGLRPMAPPPS